MNRLAAEEMMPCSDCGDMTYMSPCFGCRLKRSTKATEGRAKIIEAAREFVHYFENWEGYQEIKTSISTSIPVEFMNLCEAVETVFGPPKIED